MPLWFREGPRRSLLDGADVADPQGPVDAPLIEEKRARIPAPGRVAPLERRAAGHRQMRERQAAVVRERGKLRSSAENVSLGGSKAAVGRAADDVEATGE